MPCYNEASRLSTASFSSFLAPSTDPAGTSARLIRFVLVNDGSTDATLSILHSLRACHPDRIHVLDQQPNGGKAEAVRRGMLEAIAIPGTAYTGFWDADLATPLEAIPQLLSKLTERPEFQMVFGARVRLLGRDIHRQAIRHYLGRVFATVVSNLLRLPIYDTQCGAKLFHVTPELADVLAAPFQSRWIFDVELLARFMMRHQGDPGTIVDHIYEYPLDRWTDIAGSKLTPFDFFAAVGELYSIYRRYLAN
ncbi:MAG TPA: glycosyltransferase [Acidobacteriaceae bacterium]